MADETPIEHKDIATGQRHALHNWAVTSPTQLSSIIATASDINKLALDTTLNRYWILKSVSPSVFQELADSTTTLEGLQTLTTNLAAAVAALEGTDAEIQASIDILARICQGVTILDMTDGLDVELTAEQSQNQVIIIISAATPGMKITLFDAPENPSFYIVYSAFSTEAVDFEGAEAAFTFTIKPEVGFLILYSYTFGFGFDLFDESYSKKYITPIEQTANFTLSYYDHMDTVIYVDSATPVNAFLFDWTIGSKLKCKIIQKGAGAVSVVLDTGLTLLSKGGLYTTDGVGSVIEVMELGDGTISVSGDLV